MNSHLHYLVPRVALTLICAALAACGGGSGPDSQQSSVLAAGPSTLATSTTSPTGTDTSTATTTTESTTTTTSSTTTANGGVVTDVRLENTDQLNAQNRVPVTFGQVFAPGDLQPGQYLAGRFDDGTSVPLQVDVKATHADGSVRHAILSAVVPSIAAGAVPTMSLVRSSAPYPIAPAAPSALLSAGFTAAVHATIGGVDYSASADQLLKNGSYKTWLSGSMASEWQVSAPLTTAAGVQHPHLSARFAIRYYQGARKARVDVTIENDWAYEPAPQNFVYDASVLVGGKQVYAKAGLTHYHHARWRKLFWWGATEPALNIKQNTAYLIASRALPNFDQTLTVPELALAALKTKWTGSITEPMATGMAVPYMPNTGGRDDIGLLPGWAAEYLLSMDKRARDVTLGTADLAGSWSSHYRDKKTDRPVSLADYPYMTIVGNKGDTLNPATKQYEAFPACAGSGLCTSPNTHDSAHQPALAYLPYLVTGDYYYLEELEFWAMWNAFSSNPGYRQAGKGLFQPDQVRGQAWSLRTAAEAAYIVPDNDSLKQIFVDIVSNNLDWYNTNYTNNSAATLGALTHGTAMSYANGTGLAPWQDDFFTSAVGHAAELGFTKANALLVWKAKFPISRMIDSGACWIDGAIYQMIVRDSSTSPFYSTIGQAYKASHSDLINSLTCASAEMAAAFGLKVGEMNGYSDSPTGYPSNMQPALAYSADAGGADGKKAWSVFTGRSVKPSYNAEPQFAIVPR
jgi:hypothetical protein